MTFRKITLWLGRYYNPSLPALSLMRIAVALVVLSDLLIRWPDMEAHYSNDGIWPTRLVEQFGWKQGYWSLHTLSGSTGWQATLFVLHLLAAICLLVGWKTTLSTAVTWLLLVSLQNRNVYILQAGDDLLRMVTFLGIFLPWNAHYSLDEKRGGFFMPRSVFVYLVYLMLIASVYFFSVLLKTSAEWKSEGSAIYYALSLEQIRLPYSGDLLYRSPVLMKLLTWLVIVLEIVIPILILLPGKKGRTRKWAFFFVLILHLGIASSLYVGLFPFIGIASALGLLPIVSAERSAIIENPFSKRQLRTAIASFAAAVGGVCLLINLQGVPSFEYELRSGMGLPVNILRLDQYWGMFSPSVLKKDGWFVYHGVDDKGRQWDLRLNESNVDYKKPAHIVSMYENDRWRKLAENLQNDNFTFLRPLYASYVLRKWNELHPERPMQMLNLYYMEKTNLPDYQRPEIKKVLYCVSDGR